MQTEIIQLDGMNSETSIQKINRALSNIEGVSGVRISLPESLVEVQFNAALAQLSQLESALNGAGFQVARSQQSQSEKGGCCGGCCG